MTKLWTRRQLLGSGLKTGAALIVLGAAGYGGYRWPRGTESVTASEGVESFISRPDLKPVRITVHLSPALGTSGVTPKLVLAPRGYSTGAPGQQGVMVLGAEASLLWFKPTVGIPTNLRVQAYQGRPVLTWWEGQVFGGYGKGTGQVFDDTYRQVAAVRADNGLDADLHEFLLTPRGTALITAYSLVKTDLSGLGGPRNGEALDGVVQEVDVVSGKVVFEWHSLDHVDLAESYNTPPGSSSTAPFDYFHINSIDVAPDGDLLVSARNTWAVYKIARSSGAVVWRLHGKRSDFAMGEGARFYWQHDARALGSSSISLFDNGATPAKEEQSRGIVLGIDTASMKATLMRQYRHPARLLAPNQGSMQVLEDGGALVGWGAEPYFSQFGPDGVLLMDGRMPNNVQSYRTYRQDWVGRPADSPTLAVRPSAVIGSTVYASWNGATELAHWEVLAGSDSGSLKPVARSAKTGFETVIGVTSSGPYYAVVGLDSAGAELGRSLTVNVAS
jgi:hypothetical protein